MDKRVNASKASTIFIALFLFVLCIIKILSRLLPFEFGVEASDLISFLSLVLAVYLYYKDAIKEKDNSEVEYKLFWYKDVILQPHLSDVDVLFEKYKEIVTVLCENMQHNNDYENLISRASNDVQNVTEQVIDNIIRPIKIIDEEVYEDVKIMADDTSDLIIELIALYPCQNRDAYTVNIVDKIKEAQIQMQREMYKYGSKLVSMDKH